MAIKNNIKEYKNKKGEKLFMVKVYLGVDKRGKPVQTTRRGFKSAKEAELAEIRLKANYDGERLKKERARTFEEVYEEWLEEHKEHIKDQTTKNIKGVFKNHILPTVGECKIGYITKQDVKKLLKEKAEMSIANRINAYIKNVFSYAMENEYIKSNPTDYLRFTPTYTKEEKENWIDKEVFLKLLSIVDKEKPKWKTLINVLAYTGLRVSECLALEWQDVNLKEGSISVNKTTYRDGGIKVSKPKTSASNRLIYIDDRLVSIIKDYKMECIKKRGINSNGVIFANKYGGYLEKSLVNNKLKTLCKRIGIKKITPHGLRHTHCVLLLSAGASVKEVQERLGHSNYQITMDIYAHVEKEKSVEVPNKLLTYINY